MNNSHRRPFKGKHKKGNQRSRNEISKDRRSGTDRRIKVSSDYFRKGGVERRSWKERRHLWYMTM